MSNSASDTAESAARQRAIDWLMSRINYERTAAIPYHARQLKLDRMRQLLTRLGAPDRRLPIVHIAGTKGKGSTAAMLSAMLTAAGYKTGVYSSPHLERIEERWTIDGEPISAKQLVALVDHIRPVVETMDGETPEVGGPTFFDITTALGLLHFDQQRCDAVVLEVGLGGRLDSTNVCLPIVSVITSISLDHTRQLGDTLAKIAAEKAGIVKPGVPVVSGVTQSEPADVIAQVAKRNGCRLLLRDRDYRAERVASSRGLVYRCLVSGDDSKVEVPHLSLAGPRQVDNAAVALAVVGELRDQGWGISDQACLDGLATAHAAGRVEVFAAQPLVVVDTAHNAASAAALVEALAEVAPDGPRTLVAAVSRDKDVGAIAEQLAPAFDLVVATHYLENPRATPPAALAAIFRQSGAKEVYECDSPQAAWEESLRATPPSGTIVISGSFFIAAELRATARSHA